MKKNLLALALPLAMILPLTACASATGDTEDELTVLASTQVWADIAEAALPGTEVHAIVGADADPHSFEPSAADMARVETADIILVGGGGYDAWLYDPIIGDERIISAMDTVPHDHSSHAGEEHAEEHGIDNEHIWYSPEAVTEFTTELTEKVREISPETTVAPDAVTTAMAGLSERIAALPALRVAQTEPIADHLLADSPMTESTPSGYRATTLSEGEPTASDVAAFHKTIENGEIDLLIYNPQSASPVATSLRDLAQEAGIAIVEITETPETGEKFLDTFDAAVTALEQADR